MSETNLIIQKLNARDKLNELFKLTDDLQEETDKYYNSKDLETTEANFCKEVDTSLKKIKDVLDEMENHLR